MYFLCIKAIFNPVEIIFICNAAFCGELKIQKTAMKIILVLCCLVLIVGSMTLEEELNKGMNYSSNLL